MYKTQNMMHKDPEIMIDEFRTGDDKPGEIYAMEGYIVNEGLESRDLLANELFIGTSIKSTLQLIEPKTTNWSQNIILAAASIVVVASLYTVLFSSNKGLPAGYANDIEPGGNKAVLTLSNGQSIQLSNEKSGIVVDTNKLSYNDGTAIDQQVGQSFTVTTPRGGTYRVRLPDGSEVWLNAESKITYTPPTKDQTKYRNVELEGEAYFEVYKDVNHLFIVTTDRQKVEVLGTHFNVSAYRNELSVKTTLLEGSVNVVPLTVSGEAQKPLKLKPNQESVIGNQSMVVDDLNVKTAASWKNGDFAFTTENLESIMLKIARWYDVDVVYADSTIGAKMFNGSISKYENVSQVLCLLESTKEVRFKIDGRKITVLREKAD